MLSAPRHIELTGGWQDAVERSERAVRGCLDAATGALQPAGVVRLTMALKAVSLARGYSGVRPAVIERMLEFLHAGILWCVPSQRSVGASGDLALPAHLALPLLTDTEISRSPAYCDRVQDPSSLRCQPQVRGARLAQLRHVAADLEVEANAVTDNPIVFAGIGSGLSGGNSGFMVAKVPAAALASENRT